MAAISLKVNGHAHEVDVPPETPLLYVLSDELQLRGPKFGCGLAQCGACTVIIQGKAVRSCVMPVSAVKNREITTLEGIGTPEKPHAIQQAFIDEGAAQCGFCLSGVILTAKALLDENPKASDEQIREALVERSMPVFCAHAHDARDQALPGEARMKKEFSRRDFLKTSGALVVSFSAASVMEPFATAQGPFDTHPSHVNPEKLDSWLAVASDGTVTAYTGKCDLGQGMYTVQTQLVAEELCVSIEKVKLIQCDTSVTPDQGTTSGSQSTPTNFNTRNLAQAAATAREALIGMAAQKTRRARGSAYGGGWCGQREERTTASAMAS